MSLDPPIMTLPEKVDGALTSSSVPSAPALVSKPAHAAGSGWFMSWNLNAPTAPVVAPMDNASASGAGQTLSTTSIREVEFMPLPTEIVWEPTTFTVQFEICA